MISEEKITEILAKHDPQRLCSMGAPKDEYEFEARIIYASLARHPNNQQGLEFIVNLVHNAFIKQFNWGTNPRPDNTEITTIFLGDIAGSRALYLEPSLEIYKIIKGQK